MIERERKSQKDGERNTQSGRNKEVEKEKQGSNRERGRDEERERGGEIYLTPCVSKSNTLEQKLN